MSSFVLPFGFWKVLLCTFLLHEEVPCLDAPLCPRRPRTRRALLVAFFFPIISSLRRLSQHILLLPHWFMYSYVHHGIGYL